MLVKYPEVTECGEFVFIQDPSKPNFIRNENISIGYTVNFTYAVPQIDNYLDRLFGQPHWHNHPCIYYLHFKV
jgi:endo-1,4-beta-D-glucanase Y